MKIRFDLMNNYGKSGLEYQSHYLLNVLLESSLTEYGQKYSFSSCTSIEEFQQKVPLSDYETNKYYIEKMMRGEKNILTPYDVKWFAQTAGTT